MRLDDDVGRHLGRVLSTATPNGTLLHLTRRQMPAGVHAFHVHATGACIPPFTSAGEPSNSAGRGPGLVDADGGHAGDVPNLHVPASGRLEQEVANTAPALDASLVDADDAAIAIQAGPDDGATDPAGDARRAHAARATSPRAG